MRQLIEKMMVVVFQDKKVRTHENESFFILTYSTKKKGLANTSPFSIKQSNYADCSSFFLAFFSL